LLLVLMWCVWCLLETVQDFLIKLGIKPLMYLLEISNISINNVILRLIKIMNRADKNWARFKVNKVLKKSKFSEIFIDKSLSSKQIFFTVFFFWKELTNFRHWKMTLILRILRQLTRLFIILVILMMSLFSEKGLFSIYLLVVWCQTWSKNLGRSLNAYSYVCNSVSNILWSSGEEITNEFYNSCSFHIFHIFFKNDVFLLPSL